MKASERLQMRLDELKVFAKKSLGQNFLVSDSVIQKIIEATAEFKCEKIVEIGPGCGALTDLLRTTYSDLTLVELDKELAAFWKNEKLSVIEADALQIDWSFAKNKVLVSNLPYQISSSIVIDRSLENENLLGMVLMFQREVAQRIRGLCQTEHYGMLSVIAQEFWNIETVCDAGPRDFKPAPKVSSRVLKFTPRKSTIQDRQMYLSFIKACFKQRRRVLSTNLTGLSQVFDQSKFLSWCAENKKSDKVRAEELSPVELNKLFFYLKG